MNWQDIPSLAALRAFEAAARHQSLTLAARELNVTHAAIAQHLRTLETHFGCPMMMRNGAAMALTDEGHRLASATSSGFELIEDAVKDLAKRDAARPIRVALTPSFAAAWLMPRIGGFWAENPDIQVELVPSPKLVDLRKDGFDLAVRFGRGPWPGTQSERLIKAGHVVVAAPQLGTPSDIACVADLRDQHWLMETGRAEERLWAKRMGLDLDNVRITEFATNMLVIEAVRAGHGVTIMPSAIVANDIARGALVKFCEEEETELAYHILTPPDGPHRRVKPLVTWLHRTAEKAD